MGTLVSFHAHPDDESIGTAGTLAKAAALGHRVVLVFATRGELGRSVPGVLAEGENLAVRRSAECYASAKELGVARVEFLGYVDSGPAGEPGAEAPYSFAQVPTEQAARRLALVLEDEEADVLTTYDDNGGTGDPDRIKVHQVGQRAGELAGVPVVAQSTTNRDWMLRGMRGLRSERGEAAPDIEIPDEAPAIGKPESEITHRVEAVEYAEQKRNSMRAHASQMGPDHFLLTMPDAVFAMGLGTEFYIVDEPPNPASAPDVWTDVFEPMR
ncbi:PIG-L family deacetylase [Pseudonocardia phyllosphaerae]|uniref:PIG-L family deacetylase n=1 Tax=Pseudonocardia phyllosphaerae TaxID=3390502 RepID=UPI003979447F